MAEVRLKLQFYLSSNNLPDGEAKHKLVDILKGSKAVEGIVLVKKKRGEIELSDSEEKKEQEQKSEEDKPVSNVGKTLKFIYDNMTKQSVFNRTEISRGLYLKKK